MSILEDFLIWANERRPSLEASGMAVRTRLSPPSDNPSAALDLDTNAMVARITVWSDGSCFMEILDMGTQNEIYAMNLRVEAAADFGELSTGFFEALSSQK